MNSKKLESLLIITILLFIKAWPVYLGHKDLKKLMKVNTKIFFLINLQT